MLFCICQVQVHRHILTIAFEVVINKRVFANYMFVIRVPKIFHVLCLFEYIVCKCDEYDTCVLYCNSQGGPSDLNDEI